VSELTDLEKIESLWKARDKDNERIQSLSLLLDVAEDKIDQRDAVIKQLKSTIEALTDEIKRLSIEVNNARSAAATSVQDYRAEVGG